MMRILVVSPRVAPGILTLEAWDALRSADRVLSAEDGPHVQGSDRPASTSRSRRAARPRLRATSCGSPRPATCSGPATSPTRWWTGEGPAVEIVLGSHDLPGARLLDLVDVMGRLRRECPWTQLQTHESLAPYVLEEAQETFEAI